MLCPMIGSGNEGSREIPEEGQKRMKLSEIVQAIDDALAESSQATRDIAAQMERVAQSAERDTETARRSADEAIQVGLLASKLKALAAQFHA